MAKVERLEEVLKAIDRASRHTMTQGGPGESVVVGYTQAYAIYVHENLEAFHPVGQAKFLEQPARLLRKEFSRIIVAGLKKKLPMIKTLLMAGLRLQRESQKLVPVLTGALKGSAFTAVE